MATLGHGISEAVRNHIPVWIDDPLIDVLYDHYKQAGGVLDKAHFRSRIRVSAEWVRKSRRNTASGYERLYHCKTVNKATLIVHSPPSDMSANGYVFRIDGKPVAGGKTKLKSVQVSSSISREDKTSVRPQDVVFVTFSEEELLKMRVQAEYGDGFDYFEHEREA